MNRLSELSQIYSTVGVCYSNYQLKYLDEDIMNMCIKCFAERPEWNERVRDEHGALKVIVHPKDSFSFTITYDELDAEDVPNIQAIWRRFVAEVKYHINHQNENAIPEPSTLLKRYSCHCCGTELTTSEEGYTPQCKNCGALMHIV